MFAIEQNRIGEVVRLHEEIGECLRESLTKGLRIGELLCEQKASLPHGDFGRWIQQHLPFTVKTAQNYMRLHEHRDRLKSENVSHLASAYRLLAPGRRELPAPEKSDAVTMNDGHGMTRSLAKAAGCKAVLIGQTLARVKDQLTPDEFEEWVNGSLNFSVPMAEQFMEIAATGSFEGLFSPGLRDLLSVEVDTI